MDLQGVAQLQKETSESGAKGRLPLSVDLHLPFLDVQSHVLAGVVHVALVALQHVVIVALQLDVGVGVRGREGRVLLQFQIMAIYF